jgi:hypothetical protein
MPGETYAERVSAPRCFRDRLQPALSCLNIQAIDKSLFEKPDRTGAWLVM